jgi:hypothetical protein
MIVTFTIISANGESYAAAEPLASAAVPPPRWLAAQAGGDEREVVSDFVGRHVPNPHPAVHRRDPQAMRSLAHTGPLPRLIVDSHATARDATQAGHPH